MKKIEKTFLQNELLHWYDMEYIMLPWREDKDPYKIWISEIMLQQTRVEAVIPYFERFIKRLPTIEALSKIDEDELMKLWQGLGYYRRAKNLKVAAKQIVVDFEGQMPTTTKELMTLKGIGEYTAGAIASIAFDQVAPAVDGNILRIFARLFGVKEDIRQTSIRKQISSRYTPYIPTDRPGDFNQGLMDLGRKLCIPSKHPRCSECPLVSKCDAYKNDLQSEIPFLSKKKAKREENITVLLYINKDKIWIRKRKETGLLASLYEYTTLEDHVTKEALENNIDFNYSKIKELPKSTHMFTHIKWTIHAYAIYTSHQTIDQEGQFVDIDSLKTQYSIPTAFQTYTKWLLGNKK